VATPEDFEYGYKVDLDAFSGPLDLLLYLIRQNEVEITDIPIAEITDQYLAHVEALQTINVNLAGEFLLMAATLMEIKSRLILPRHDDGEEEDEEDPRGDLIRQLLEYKRFKDAARTLGDRGDQQALKFGRGTAAALGLPEREPEDDLPMFLGDVTAWDLVAAFQTILKQTSLPASHRVVLDKKPIVAYCNELLGILGDRKTATFQELFPKTASRTTLVSYFFALLELMRRRRLRAEQDSPHADIRIVLLDATPLLASEVPDDEPQPAEAIEPTGEGEAGDEAPEPAPPDAPKPPKGKGPRGWRPKPTFRLEEVGFEDADEEFARMAKRLASIDVPPVRLRPPPAYKPIPRRESEALRDARLRRRQCRREASVLWRLIERPVATPRRPLGVRRPAR